MIALRKETDEMKEKMDQANRFKAEMAQGISVLSQKLGVFPAGNPSRAQQASLPDQIKLCDEKVKEFLVQKRALGSQGVKSSAINSVLSSQASNVRVKVPDLQNSASRRGAMASNGAKDGADDSESSDEEMFRNSRNSARR